jgi:3-isopropylmalate dehydrogenase
MDALITLLPGDGVGPEVTAAAHRVLKAVAAKCGHKFEFDVQLIGGAAIDQTGEPLPENTIVSCKESNAILLGAVGGPQWSDPNATVRPEQGLLGLRAVLGVYANLRPIKVIDDLIGASPIKEEYLSGVDLIVVRELTGGIYFGEKTRDKSSASDLCVYHTHEIERIVRVAAELADQRRGKLCSVDKANVMETSRLWREVTDKLLAAELSMRRRCTCCADRATLTSL